MITPPDGFDVSELPERYQELFNQPIWNANISQPSNWDAPEPPAPDPAAAIEKLAEGGTKAFAEWTMEASYYGPQELGDVSKGTLTTDTAERAEMTGLGYAGDPDADGRDNVIRAYPGVHPSDPWTRAHLGEALPTLEQWRGTSEYALFQLFGSEVDQLVELSYGHINLAPGGRTAYQIAGHNYYRWNLPTGLGEEGLDDFVWYDQFIAPEAAIR